MGGRLMTKKKFDFIMNALAIVVALFLFGLMMCNDITLRKTGEEIPHIFTLLMIIFGTFIIVLIIMSKIRKKKFGEDEFKQTNVTWKSFLRNFIIIMFTNMMMKKSHRIAKSARYGMIESGKAVTDITKIYCLYFVLFFTLVFVAEYFEKKKANYTETSEE